MSDEEKARKLYAEAEKKAGGGGGFFSSLMGGGKDDAAELYIKSANLFKMAKKWNEAGGSFVKAAEMALKRGEAKHEAATNYVDAANCFRKNNIQAAVDCMGKACDIYTDMGRFTMAAKHHTTIAEMYEADGADLTQAINHYQKAGDYYKGEESKSSANKCYLKVAEFAAKQEQYDKAIEIYEEIGSSNADNSLLKYSAKDYFFRALLCHLCRDLIDTQHALKKYMDLHPQFADSRECKLIKDLILCLEEQNQEEFTAVVSKYDQISRLDDWYTMLLVRIKRQCGEAEGDDLR